MLLREGKNELKIDSGSVQTKHVIENVSLERCFEFAFNEIGNFEKFAG